MNSYSDSNSLFSFNPVDYIDLDSALEEEELCYITHSNVSRQYDNYKFSLKSMNDTDLDSFRRSLITPMSVNAKVNDSPMNTTTRRRRDSPVKRADTISPTHSCNESVALFNNILNDDGVDFVKSDLKDFMTTYDMDDLLSRPGSSVRLPNTTPSPQNMRVSRHNTNMETTNMNDNNNTTTNLNVTHKSPFIRGRKSSVDVSVQTPSSFTAVQRRMSSPALEPEPKVVLKPTNSKERVQKKLSLLKLSQNQQIHSSPDDKRRWSSYIPEAEDQNSRYTTQKSSVTTSNLLPTSRYNREKRSSVDTGSRTEGVERRASQRNSMIINPSTLKMSSADYQQQQSCTSTVDRDLQSRDLQRRASNRKSLLTTEPNNNATVERRSNSLRRVPLMSQLKEKNNNQTKLERRSSHSTFSLANKNNDQQQQQAREITNRYAERRSSYRDLAVNSKVSNNNEDHLTFLNRRMERRPSQEPISSSNNRATALQQAANNKSKRYSYHGGYGSPPLSSVNTTEEAPQIKTDQQQRRSRALSVPTSTDQQQKPSLMPVPVSRLRKYSNNGSSRYASVPENEIAPSTGGKVRFSVSEETKGEEIVPIASRSTGGYSNSTASSSHSGDLDYDPPTPPSSFIDRHEHAKRRSIPNFPGKETPRLNRYSSYLARLKDAYEPMEEEKEKVIVEPRRQRVHSEDNENYYKGQQRITRQENLNESARELLAQVKQRRAKTAAILHGIYGPSS